METVEEGPERSSAAESNGLKLSKRDLTGRI